MVCLTWSMPMPGILWSMARPVHLLLVLALCSALTAAEARAQAAQPPKHEFRGAWIATVFNLDWPRAASPAEQQAELLLMLDRLSDAGINAVFFQVRTECDALYDSPLEPWSRWLTGRQGAAPDPWYDPLAFAVREAHRRGMELHAWFNPYRAREGSAYERSADHVTRTHPQWVLQFGDLRILDPGRAAVREYVTRVVMDVARRYDIDGVHFDDYFYPYPPNHISDEDAATFAEESRGFTSLPEWRRDNVNLFIAQVADSLRALRPALKFGVSPFGIWKNGVPEGIQGLDAHDVIFADPTAWLAAGTVDYLAPQLYWPFGGPQDYESLASWWAEQIRGLHLYTGHALYRAASETNFGTLFSAEEIPRQVRFSRDIPEILGSVFFRARNLTHHSSQGFAEVLKTELYQHPALTPPMAWKASEPPAAPGGVELTSMGDGEVELSWHPVEGSRRYAVYRVRSSTSPDPEASALDARNLLAVTGETALVDRPEGSEPHHYFVRAVGGNSSESDPSALVRSGGPTTAVAMETATPRMSLDVYPNPFNATTRIALTVEETAPVSLRIYNQIGQRVRTLVEGEWLGPGAQAFEWDAADDAGRPLASGVYYLVVKIGGYRLARSLALVR
ncbi:MAG: family 10 glycosylhydrolase [Gemmatimonadaceae bacterium]|nr:family 10 glycosylhydrolase [Gemmatimonadaceae bacterium]